MVCGLLLHVHVAEDRIKISEFLQLVSLAGNSHQRNEYLGQHFSIVDSAVMVEVAQFKFLCNRIKLEVPEVRKRCAAQLQRIHIADIIGQPLALAADFDEGSIEIRVMRHQNALSGERDKLLQSFFLGGRVLNHLVGDSGQFRDICRNGSFGVYEGLESVHDLHIAELHRTDFGYPVEFTAESGGFYIENDNVVVHGTFIAAGYQRAGVVDKIRLHAVDYLELAAVLADFLHGVHRFGVCLDVSVVSNGNSLVSPCERLVHQVRRRSYRVHIRHSGMQVKFHALFLRLVLALLRLDGSN